MPGSVKPNMELKKYVRAVRMVIKEIKWTRVNVGKRVLTGNFVIDLGILGTLSGRFSGKE